MYQPNTAQWRVIWIGFAVSFVLWMLAAPAGDWLALLWLAVIIATLLGVWRLAR